MGRARHGGPARDGAEAAAGGGRDGGRLTPRAAIVAALLVLPLAACRGFLSDESTPVAVQLVSPPDTIAVGDTVPVTVEALNRDGGGIPDAAVFLLTLSPDTIGIGPDSVSVIGLAGPGSGSVMAGVGNLRSAPFRIVVQ